MSAWVEDDFYPDGRPTHINQAAAELVLNEAKSRRVSAVPAPFPPVSARDAAAQKPEVDLTPRRRVGGFVGTGFFIIAMTVVASFLLGVARIAGVL